MQALRTLHHVKGIKVYLYHSSSRGMYIVTRNYIYKGGAYVLRFQSDVLSGCWSNVAYGSYKAMQCKMVAMVTANS